jgi:hypothetical protein
MAEITLRQGMEIGLHAFKAWLALSVIMNLHKPRGAEPMWCGECVIFDGQPHPYPCPTIEAIEKELTK